MSDILLTVSGEPEVTVNAQGEVTVDVSALTGGDVDGPASSTDNALARFDGTTGKLIQNGQITQSDTGDLAAINSLAMDTTPTSTLATQGQMMWNADEETLDIQLNGFALHVGEHVVFHVKNSTGSTITKGVPVMFAGTTGNSGKLLIQPWNGTGPATYFMGLTGESLIDGAEGFVIAFGKLRGIQTNGGNYSQTWVDGDILYAGSTTGNLTNVAPTTGDIVQVAAVVHAHASNGTLFVRVNWLYQPANANLNAISGLTSAADKLPYFTGAGTAAVTDLSSFGRTLIDDADAATARSTLSLGTLATQNNVLPNQILPNIGSANKLFAVTSGNLTDFISVGAGLSRDATSLFVATGGVTDAMLAGSISPSKLTVGTGVAAALGINVGTAGAVVVNGGALGTPSSGVLTSCTGLPINTGVSGLGTNVATSLANNMGASGTLAILGANTFTGVQTATGFSLTSSANQFLAVTGGAAPQYSAAGSTTNGMRVASDRVDFWIGGSVQLTIQSGSMGLGSTPINFGSNTQLFGNSDGTGRLVERNGTSAQTFSIANTYTSFTNKEELEIGWVGNSNIGKIRTIKGSGGGTARALCLGTDSTDRMGFEATTFNTFMLASSGSYGGGSGVLFMGNATTVPTTNPTGGGILYVEAGALKYRGSSGTITTLANA